MNTSYLQGRFETIQFGE